MRRAQTLEDLGEASCAMCAVPFRVESIILMARGFADEWSDTGKICPMCLECLSTRNPSAFLSLEDYREALKCHPEPIWASDEEAEQMFNEDREGHDTAYEAARISPGVSR